MVRQSWFRIRLSWGKAFIETVTSLIPSARSTDGRRPGFVIMMNHVLRSILHHPRDEIGRGSIPAVVSRSG